MRRLLSLLLLLGIILSATSSAFHKGKEKEEIVVMTVDDDKRKFPEYVGLSGEEVRTKLESERPTMIIQIVNLGDMVTMDYREDRIRIWVDDNGIVTKPPKVG